MSSSRPLQDSTPVCTPSVLERRKSMVVDEDADDEIVVKLPVTDKGDSSEEEEEEGDESESEEPSEEEAEW